MNGNLIPEITRLLEVQRDAPFEIEIIPSRFDRDPYHLPGTVVGLFTEATFIISDAPAAMRPGEVLYRLITGQYKIRKPK